MNFRAKIVNWYLENKRDLPWRKSTDPYNIWVSEIILQQTRVDQGLPYYYRFIESFPDVKTLAAASEQEVLNVWKGLGYYSRARYMHSTAQMVIDKFEGKFPVDYESLLKLKGIGSYTAAAIASICNHENKPAIDGNVIRVLSRYFGVSDAIGSSALLKKIRWISGQLIPDGNPGDYNQAMMEYGAVICTPALPKCSDCIFNRTCFAFENKMTGILPVKKKTMVKKFRYFNYLHLVTTSGNIFLKKRTSDDIWRNLWDFPLIESDKLLEPENVIQNLNQITGINENTVFVRYYDTAHILTHQNLQVRFFTIKIPDNSDLTTKSDHVLIKPGDTSYPVPRLIENFFKRNDIFFGYD